MLNPILAEIYSTVLDAAPFVIAAYALIFVVLLVYVAFALRSLSSAEKRLQALEEHVERLRAE